MISQQNTIIDDTKSLIILDVDDRLLDGSTQFIHAARLSLLVDSVTLLSLSQNLPFQRNLTNGSSK